MDSQAIWNRFALKLHNFIKTKIKISADAEDILQEVFVKVHLHKDKLSDETKLESWIFTITRNIINDYYKKSFRLKQEQENFPKSLIENDEDLHAICNCLLPFMDELPSQDRELLNAVYFEDKPQKELAATLQIPYSSLKSKVQRARQKLQAKFVTCCHHWHEANGQECENC